MDVWTNSFIQLRTSLLTQANQQQPPVMPARLGSGRSRGGRRGATVNHALVLLLALTAAWRVDQAEALVSKGE